MPDASIPNVEQGQAITAGLENLIINGVNKAVLVSDLYRVDGFGVPFDPNVKNRGDLPAPFILETRIYANKVEKTEETTSWPPSQRYMQQWIFLSSLADLKGFLKGDQHDPDNPLFDIRTVSFGADESSLTEVTSAMLATGWLCLLWDEDDPSVLADSIYLNFVEVEPEEGEDPPEIPQYDIVISNDGIYEGAAKAFKIGGYKDIEVQIPGEEEEPETVTVKKWFNCIGNISSIAGGMAGWVTNAPQAAHLTTNYSYDARVTVLYFNELPPEP